MQPAKKLLNKLNGYAYRQEYLCLADEPYINPLHAYMVFRNEVVANITTDHLFVGYSPLIIALPESYGNHQELNIRFTHELLSTGDPLRNPLAWLNLRQIHQTPGIVYYEGTKGNHRFVPSFNQFINGVNNSLYQQKTGNVYLNNKLYPQVQIAYAIPREISLITVEGQGGLNLFPTDLHGAINTQYIISLRKGGMACQQVQEAGKIALSKMQPDMYKEVYKLGKNHMQPPRSQDAFPFDHDVSKEWGLPLPQNNIGYRELELESSFDHGIHRLLLFNIINQQIEAGSRPLAHIHNSYATWRFKHGLPGNYLLR